MAHVLEVISPGPLSTLQDLGRRRRMKYGVPPSGALDQEALAVANLLAGNPEAAVGMEITYGNFVARALAPTVLACAGAWAPISVDTIVVSPWTAFGVIPGQVVTIGAPTWGVRVYLALSGGIAAPLVMDSAAACTRAALGGIDGHGRALRAGDLIAVPDRQGPASAQIPGALTTSAATARAAAALAKRQAAFVRAHSPGAAAAPSPAAAPASTGRPVTVRVVMGPQDDHFTDAGRRTLITSEFTLTNRADRMGLRFEGPAIEHSRGADIISDGMPAGAIQVPGDGKPIIMLADRQTTGGYPKIACVARVDLDLLAHLRPGDRVRFAAMTIDEAHESFALERAAWQAGGRAFRILIDGAEHITVVHEVRTDRWQSGRMTQKD